MDYKIVASVANPGSALGEAIGSSMEDALKELLRSRLKTLAVVCI